MNKIIAVIVTYNRKELLKESIEALRSQTYKDMDILVVDNASTDGTYDNVVKKYDNLKYINTGSNIGGAGGFNLGMKYAIENNYEYAWLMDDDTIAMPTALQSLMKKANILNDEFSYLSSIVKWTDNSICKMNIQILNKKWIYDYEKIQNNLILLEKCSFVSCFVNLKIAKKVGLPIKEFFIYGDDWEYTLRLSKEKNGYVDCDSIVIHKMKENFNASIINMPSEKIPRHYYNCRNLSYTYRKISKKIYIKYVISNLLEVIKILIKSKNYRLKRIYYLLKGIFAGMFFNPKIEYVK